MKSMRSLLAVSAIFPVRFWIVVGVRGAPVSDSDFYITRA